MPNLIPAIANEFDSYLQDRAQRLGYRMRRHAADEACALPGGARLALVEFRDTPPGGCAIPSGMRECHDRGHFVAWTGEAGALVRMNVYRKEMDGDSGEGAASRIGVRTFAEEFFCNERGRSLPLAEFTAYLTAYMGWLAAEAAAPGAAASTLALVARIPEARELVLVRAPSIAAADGWLRRSTQAPS